MLIDLDTLRLEQPVKRSRPRPWVRRSARLGFIVLLSTAVLAASTPAPSQAVTVVPLQTTPAAVELDPDAAYVAFFGTGAGATVRGYALSDGAERWSATLPFNVDSLSARKAAGVLVAQSPVRPDGPGPLAVLDTATGHLLWQGPRASVAATFADLAMLVTFDGGQPAELRTVGLRTGHVVWSRQLGSDQEWHVTSGDLDGGARVALTKPDGEVTVLDVATGDVVVSGRLDVPLRRRSSPGQDDFTAVLLTGDTLYVSRHAAQAATLVAYRTATLTQLWRVSEGIPGGYLVPCGLILCVGNGQALAGIDPRTGAIRWMSSRWTLAVALRPDRLLVSAWTGSLLLGLLDATTGRLLTTIGQPIVPSRQPQPLLFPDAAGRHRGVLVIVDVNGPALRVVAGVDEIVPSQCMAAGRYVACPTLDGKLRIWHVAVAGQQPQ